MIIVRSLRIRSGKPTIRKWPLSWKLGTGRCSGSSSRQRRMGLARTVGAVSVTRRFPIGPPFAVCHRRGERARRRNREGLDQYTGIVVTATRALTQPADDCGHTGVTVRFSEPALFGSVPT
jgi:hypothetical protein